MCSSVDFRACCLAREGHPADSEKAQAVLPPHYVLPVDALASPLQLIRLPLAPLGPAEQLIGLGLKLLGGQPCTAGSPVTCIGLMHQPAGGEGKGARR